MFNVVESECSKVGYIRQNIRLDSSGADEHTPCSYIFSLALTAALLNYETFIYLALQLDRRSALYVTPTVLSINLFMDRALKDSAFQRNQN